MESILRKFLAVFPQQRTSGQMERHPDRRRKSTKKVKEDDKKKRFRVYKNTMKGVVGRLTWKDFHSTKKIKQLNWSKSRACEINRERRAPMFAAMEVKRSEAIARHRGDCFAKKYNHSASPSFNGIQKP